MNIANIITGSRLVMFVVFIWAIQTGRPLWAALLFFGAWSLDAVDGWVARKLGQESVFGYIFDKAVDRIVLFVGLIVLLMNRAVPDYAFLILVKDIATLPAATVQLNSLRAMPSMGKEGKVAAVGQGLAVFWVWAQLPGSGWVVLLVAGFGAIVGGRYVFEVYGGKKAPGFNLMNKGKIKPMVVLDDTKKGVVDISQ